MRKARKYVVSGLVALTLAVVAAPAYANPAPPTNGGNGAGQSGQCTGSPSGRPAPCPGT
jgi:hypothetical protein